MPCVSNSRQVWSSQVKAFLRLTFLPEISTHLLGLEFLCELSYWRWAAGAAEPHGLGAAAARLLDINPDLQLDLLPIAKIAPLLRPRCLGTQGL